MARSPEDKQRGLGERLMRTLGFDFDAGRLAVRAAPASILV